MIRKKEEWKALSQCEECSLNGRPFVPPYIPRVNQYRALFIGQEPGDNEQHTGVPFTGDAGKQHFSLMKSAGLNKLLFPHDNICSCFPQEDWVPNHRDAHLCSPRLITLIQEYQPLLIVALGEVAMQNLTGQSGITSRRGSFNSLLGKYNYECKVLCLLHPSFIQRQRQWIPLAVQNYRLIHSFFQGSLETSEEYEFTYDPDEHWLEEYLNSKEIIDCDTETTGLECRKDIILGWSFSSRDKTACAVYLKQPIQDDPRFPILKSFFENPERLKCWQNGCFDTGFARANGIQDEGFVYDTRLAQQLLKSDLPTDLDFLRAEHTNLPPYKPPKKDMKTTSSWPKHKLLEYACKDVQTLREVRKVQSKLLSNGQMKIMQELLIPLVRAIDKMQNRGILVDLQAVGGIYARIAPRLQTLMQPFNELGLNPKSPKQMARYFQTKDTNEKTLIHHVRRLHSKGELMQTLLEYRGLQRLESTYLRGIYKRLEKGRIHTNFKIDGTGTGRLASENPNLQNIPDIMRLIYISDPGFKLMKGDYSQIELWVAAVLIYQLTGCEALLKDLEKRVDIHYNACQRCFPDGRKLTGNRKVDFTEREQLVSKAVVFGSIYGRTAYSIAVEFGVTVMTAEIWQEALVGGYPGIQKYRDHCTREFNSKGYLETPYGLRRYLQTVRQGFNFPVQSTAAVITLKAIVEADREGLELLLSVHDDILIEYEDNDTEKFRVYKAFKRAMIKPQAELNGIAFNAKFYTGYNWEETKEEVTDEQADLHERGLT